MMRDVAYLTDGCHRCQIGQALSKRHDGSRANERCERSERMRARRGLSWDAATKEDLSQDNGVVVSFIMCCKNESNPPFLSEVCEGRSSINRTASMLASDGDHRGLFDFLICKARVFIA